MGFRRYFLVVLVLWMPGYGHGEDMVCPALDRPVRETFDGFLGAFDTLPAGFGVAKVSAGEMSAEDEDFRGESRGSVTAGGCYAWLIEAGNHALGYQPTADEFTPGYFRLCVSNGTGQVAHRLSVAYTVVYLNNADRSSSLELWVSRDGENYVPVGGTPWCTPAGREEQYSWVRRSVRVVIPLDPPLGAGRLWLRWCGDDAGGTGSRDEYGLDEVRVTLHPPAGTVVSFR
jgi:hypothetical protein